MGEIRARWALLAARIDALTVRERALTGLAVLSILYASWNGIFSEPMSREHQRLQQQLVGAKARSEAMSRAAETLVARGTTDPNREIRERLGRLQSRMATLELRKNELAAAFISPRAMADLLRELLGHGQSLKLLSLQIAAPRSLSEQVDKGAPAPSPKPESTAVIYRHEMTLEIEGIYFDALDYLRALEPQALFWDSVEYTVEHYPLARVRLKVYTLSFEKEWLSV